MIVLFPAIRNTLIMLLVVFIVPIPHVPVVGDYPPSAQIAPGDFTIIVLPDTQYYSAWLPHIFETQTQWIADNQEALNIQAVLHLGDVVNWMSTPTQWERAEKAMDNLGDIPALVAIGNHDYDDLETRDSTTFNSYYGPENGYILVQDYIIISVEYQPRPEALTWLRGVLDDHSDLQAIIITHAQMPDDDLSAAISGYNVSLVLSGHYDGMKRWVSSGVDHIQANFQHYLGGNGYLLILTFRDDGIDAVAYSPFSKDTLIESRYNFTLEPR